MRAELAFPGLQFVSYEVYNQLFTMRGAIMLLLFVTPLFAGFANAIMPLHIGAPDVAFPRLTCSPIGPSALALTGAIELPINTQVLTWSRVDPPPGWQALRDRWDRVHTARTVSAVLGLACLAAATFQSNEEAST